jgi:SAM-dependent methyltransferase
LPVDSAIRAHHHGHAWGIEMFRLLGRARVVINRHADFAGQYANNMRLYEATGMGACLVTERKANLGDLFALGTEIIEYTSPTQVVNLVRELLDDDVRRGEVAGAGQRRTLREHSYRARTEAMSKVIEDVLDEVGSSPSRQAGAGPDDGWRRPGLAEAVKSVVKSSPLRPVASRAVRVARAFRAGGEAVSTGHSMIVAEDVEPELRQGWKDTRIPAGQRKLVDRQLRALRHGRPPAVYRVAAEAIRATGLDDPKIIEIGCASGYYRQALNGLLGTQVRYVGLDYSEPLLIQGKARNHGTLFVAGDAARLPFREGSADIVLSSAVLMHVPNYVEAIEEIARVSRRFCVVHRTPLVIGTATTTFRKLAYGVPVVELVFNEAELLSRLRDNSLEVRATWLVEESTIDALSEPVRVMTYLAEHTN